MEVDEARERMREIQRIMETATLFTLLPGTAAIVGGLLVLVGCGISCWLLQSLSFGDIVGLTVPGSVSLCMMWFAIAVASVAVNAFFTLRLAARQRIAINPRPAQVATFALTPCVVVAAVLSLKFLTDWQPQEIRYIAPVWILLYGTGVYTAGLFSLRAPRARPGLPAGGHRGLVRLPRLRRAFRRGNLRRAARRLWRLCPHDTAAGRGPMSEPIKPGDIDGVIHERARLSIVSALAVTAELSFGELKSMLGLTDGNLSVHARTLEEAGYIIVDKSFQGRRPHTSMRLTAKGRKAFARYLETLRQIVDQGSREGQGSS